MIEVLLGNISDCFVVFLVYAVRQVNFLTDEAGNCGKGANAVIS